MKKSLIAIMMTAIILLSLAAPLIAILPVKATDPSDWYMTVDGVLDSDYYVLYPYETDASLKVGFSKYGELINSADNVGLEYAEVDPFAPPTGSGLTAQVPKRMWVQGWFINITYYHRTLGWRNVWATAIHSDGVVYGNDWLRVDFTNDWSASYGYEDPRDMGYLIYGDGTYGSTLLNGGRKTNGTAVTDSIEVLYDGPREFIAVCRTTIYDHPLYMSNSTASDIALVQIAITIRFDKVKKDVVLLKDVKSLLAWKEGEKMKIQFSNRGEVDLGTEEVAYGSYAHFWTEGTAPYDLLGADDVAEGLDTVYDADWQLIQTENPATSEYINYSAAGPYPQTSDATFDYAQAVNPSAGYVWSAAFWPSLSDWSIDGWEQWWQSLMAYDPHYIDYRTPSEEPFIPFYIGEWDFELWHTVDNYNRTQFRGVTQYAVTDLHDGHDAAQGSGGNKIDSEMQYYLNQTFNPWDLQDAVHKYTRRWLEWKTTTSTSYTTQRRPVVVVPKTEWDAYCNFADRVVNMVTGQLLNRADGDYSLTLNADGTATFTGLPTAKCKILYSTEAYYEKLDLDPIVLFNNDTSVGVEAATSSFYDYDYVTFTDPLGMHWSVGVDDLSFVATALNTTDSFNVTFSRVVNGWESNFEVFKGDTYTGSWDFQNLALLTDDVNASVAISLLDIHWSVYNPTLQDLYIWELGFTATVTINLFYNATGGYMEMTATVDLNPADPYAGMTVMYEEGQMGRYEWVTVGRDAATVDSAGSALIAEAFDSLKEIQIGMAGADMENAVVANMMPWVMSNFAAGTSVSSYKDGLLRAALRDDFCTKWPVASSNMIGTGGPLANLFAYYANDFTDAFYGLDMFAGAAYDGKIVPITCWNRNWPGYTYNTYASSTTTGYAVITTHKDINGTVLFNVWGHWGRDTYYASLWLHGDEARGLAPGIIELQSAPKGVTSIILKINYGSDPYHPTYTIPEVLGTISETLWYHSSTDVTNPWKGGIHDP